MKINDIVLTIEEVHEAIETWLKQKGMVLKVTHVSSNGYPVKDYDVKCETVTPLLPPRVEYLNRGHQPQFNPTDLMAKEPITSIKGLTAAIEKGTV